MLFSVEQAFVGRDENRAPVKTPVWEASSPHDQRFLLEQGRIYQNRIYGWICPSNLTCWYYSQKMMQNKLKMEFACSNLKRVVAWEGQRRINLGCRYPRKYLLTCRKRHPTSIFGNIFSEDDLRSRNFGTFVVKFLACMPLLEFRTSKNGIIAHF